MSGTPKRGWLSFSIRDLMWFTLAVALLLCIWLQYSAHVSERDAMKSHLEETNYDSQIWKARTRELQNRDYMLIEHYRVSSESNSSEPAPNAPKP
jgi:hypothetical protein